MSSARIFLAEDNEQWRDTLRAFLERNGHKVVLEATTLDEGLQLAKTAEQFGVDIAILNYSLGTSTDDGIKIAQHLSPRIKIISWTVAYDLGRDDAYVEKGDPEELLPVIERLLSEGVKV